MTINKEVQIIISAKDAASKVVRNVENTFGGFAKKAQNQFDRVSRSVNQIAENARALALPLTIAGGAAVAMGDNFVEMAFRAETGTKIFNKMLQRVGENEEQVRKRMKELSESLRLPVEVIEQNSKDLLRKGYNFEQIADIYEGAVASGLIMGKDTIGSIERVNEALVSEMSIQLNRIGIAENLSTAYQNYAEQLGKTKAELTETEKAAATHLMIQKATAAELEDLPELFKGYGGAVASLGEEWYDARVILGDQLMPVWTQYKQGAADLLNTFNNLSDKQRDIIWGVGEIAVKATAAAGGIALLAAAGSLVTKVFGILGGIASLVTTPVVVGAAAMAAAGLAIYTAWDENWLGIQDTVMGVWENTLQPTFEKAWEWSQKAWEWGIKTGGNAWSWIKDTSWQEKIEDMKGWLTDGWKWAIKTGGEGWYWLDEKAPWLTNTLEIIYKKLETAWNWSIKTGGDAWKWITDTTWQQKLQDTKEMLSGGWNWTVDKAKEGAGVVWDWLGEFSPGTQNTLEVAWEWSANMVGDTINWVKNTALPWIDKNDPLETIWKWSVEGIDKVRDIVNGNANIQPKSLLKESLIKGIDLTSGILDWVHESGSSYKLGEITGEIVFKSLKFIWDNIIWPDPFNLNEKLTRMDMALNELVVNVAHVAWDFAQGVADSFWESLFGTNTKNLARATRQLMKAIDTGGSIVGGIEIPANATGGKITGPGTGTSDSIVARISNGEYIVNAKSTRKWLPLLEAINNGKLPAFQGGGLNGIISGFTGNFNTDFNNVSKFIDDISENFNKMITVVVKSITTAFEFIAEIMINLAKKIFGEEKVNSALSIFEEFKKTIEGILNSDSGGSDDGEDRAGGYGRIDLERLDKYRTNELNLYEKIIENLNSYNKLLDKNEKAMSGLIETISIFSEETANAIQELQNTLNFVGDLPTTINKLENGFSALTENVSNLFGGGKIGRTIGKIASGYAGYSAFSASPGGGTNIVGGITGALAGIGMINPLWAVGASLIGSMVPNNPKDQGDKALQERISQMNDVLEEWGASFRSPNVRFKDTANWLEGLFGGEDWKTIGKEAAQKGAQTAEQIINSMKQTFSDLGGSLGEVLFNNMNFDNFSKFVGRRLQQLLMNSILQTEAIKEPLQRLSAFMAEAVQDGLTDAETSTIKDMSRAIFEGMSEYEGIAGTIAEQFGLAEDAINGINSSLRNVPSGFKVALNRYTSAIGVTPSPSRSLATSGGGNNLTIQFAGPVFGMDDFEDKVKQIASKYNTQVSLSKYGVGDVR